jgi:hypothetical protein
LIRVEQVLQANSARSATSADVIRQAVRALGEYQQRRRNRDRPAERHLDQCSISVKRGWRGPMFESFLFF